ncbi:MAG: pitrilysin family protein [Gammaproteobacteria bacterium]
MNLIHRLPHRLRGCLHTILLCSLAASANAVADTSSALTRISGADAIASRTLANGLQIIVWPDEDIPNVAWYHWVKVGSRNERPGITGISHFFEHMMFQGTSERAPGEFDRVMEAGGGVNNAYTSNDVTVYTDWFPRSALELIFEIESDRFANLSFDPETVESERGVILSERRSTVDDRNMWYLAEQMQAVAFVAHPYQIPIIGWPSDIAAWTLEDLQTHFRVNYAPNNTVLVVVGAVTPDEVFEKAEQYFGKIPAQPAPAEVRTVEPEQQGQRRIELRRPGQTAFVQAVFHIPPADDPAMPALKLLVDILATGSSSRLYQRLIEQEQSAIEVDAYVEENLDPGLLWFMTVLPGDGDPASVEAALFAELERITDQGVTAAELDKARNIQLAAFWRQLATIDGKADLLGTYEVFHGDYRKLFAAPSAYQAVTTEDIKALAARILKVSNSTVGTLVPARADQEAGS